MRMREQSKRTVCVVIVAMALGIIANSAFGDDTTPPELVDFGFAPASVDVTFGSQDVTFTWRITDDVSGFNYVHGVIYSPSGHQHTTFYANSSDRLSGDAWDGVYQTDVTFAENAESGTWYIQQMNMSDHLNTERLLWQADLIAIGFPTEIEVNVKPPEEAAVVILTEAVEVIEGLDSEDLSNKNSGDTLITKLETAIRMIEAGRYIPALNVLENDILAKTDGCAVQGQPDQNDWIITCAAQAEVYDSVVRAIDLLQGLI